MQMSSLALRLLLLPLFALFSIGCGGGNWLVGKWTLDKERTLEEVTKARESTETQDVGEGLLSDLAGGVEKGIFRLLLTQFEGVEFEITPTEIKRIRDGVGSTRKYEIVERPEPGIWIVKTADGEFQTWARTDTGIRLKFSDEDDQRWVFFKPVE